MSVKLSNSGEPASKRINIETIRNIINFTKDSYLKFVIGVDTIKNVSQEINQLVSNLPKCEIYLMPLGDTAEIIDKNSLNVINFSILKGYKYSDRLHIRVWNNKRGV